MVLADVARNLGVRYVVEGSVQRAGEQTRISAQLVDTTTGDHLWADRFDRGAAEVFAVQDEMSRDIIRSLGMTPTASETQRIARPPTANLEAYDYYLRGEQAARTGRASALREALDFYARAVTLDPDFAEAFAADARAAVNIWRSNLDSVLQSALARKRAYENAGRALQLNPDLSLPYAMLAILQVVDERYEEAIESVKRAVALGPGDVEAHVALGYVYLFAGKFTEAAAAIDIALKLDPNLSPADREVAGFVFFFNGENDRAIATLERARADAPGAVNILVALAAAYARAGRISDARAAVAEGIQVPQQFFPFSNPDRLGALSQRQRPDIPYRRPARGRPPRMAFQLLRRRTRPAGWRGDCAARAGPHVAGTHRARVPDDDADRPGRQDRVPVVKTVPH